MAEDDDISRRYRELPREEPPRRLDDTIRAAARRAVRTRPAPLVVPTGRQRWYFPLAAAAIIVLAVAVTIHVEREQPVEEIVSAPAAPAEESKAEKPQASPQPERRRKTESADSRELRDTAPPPELQKAPEPAPVPPSPPATAQDAIALERNAAGALSGRAEPSQSAPAPQAAPPPPPVAAAAGRPAPVPEAKPMPQAPRAGAASPRASAELRRPDEGARTAASVSAYALQSPEQWLQGIADLRRQGRNDEADKSLAEFRKRYPDYKITDAMLREVERR